MAFLVLVFFDLLTIKLKFNKKNYAIYARPRNFVFYISQPLSKHFEIWNMHSSLANQIAHIFVLTIIDKQLIVNENDFLMNNVIINSF